MSVDIDAWSRRVSTWLAYISFPSSVYSSSAVPDSRCMPAAYRSASELPNSRLPYGCRKDRLQHMQSAHQGRSENLSHRRKPQPFPALPLDCSCLLRGRSPSDPRQKAEKGTFPDLLRPSATSRRVMPWFPVCGNSFGSRLSIPRCKIPGAKRNRFVSKVPCAVFIGGSRFHPFKRSFRSKALLPAVPSRSAE